MPWTPVKTWGVQPWTATDANAYIRDNTKSWRNIAVGQKMFLDGPVAVTAAAYTNVATHLTLCPVAPDEITTMLVYVEVLITANTGTPTGWNTRIKDQAGTVITSASYAASNYTSHSRMGQVTVASGTNPGFTVEMLVTGTTPNLTCWFQSVCWIAPTVGP